MSTREELIEHCKRKLSEKASRILAADVQRIRDEGRPEQETQALIEHLELAIALAVEDAERGLPGFIDECIALHEQHRRGLH